MKYAILFLAVSFGTFGICMGMAYISTKISQTAQENIDSQEIKEYWGVNTRYLLNEECRPAIEEAMKDGKVTVAEERYIESQVYKPNYKDSLKKNIKTGL